MTRTSKRPSELDREIAQALAGTGYRVAYLAPNPRRGRPGEEAMQRLWYTEGSLLSLGDAKAALRSAKSRGYTAWVTDADGGHVPVPGATRPYPGRYSVP